MMCVSVLSKAAPPESAIADVAERLAERLAGATAELAVLFGSPHHAESLGELARTLRTQGLARSVVGCTGESIAGEEEEVEGAPALSVLAVKADGMQVTPRRLWFDSEGLHGWTDREAQAAEPASTLVLMGDPYTFPIDRFALRVNEASKGVRIVGGMASASHVPGGNRLVLDDEVFDGGAVGVEVAGSVQVRTIVSQGCRPIGRTLIVTKVERNLIRELGRRPALEVLREMFEGLEPEDQDRVRQGLHIGRVISEYQESFGRGDFLVRNVLGADEDGGIAITDLVRVGQTVQFHVRDADSADEDLRTMLEDERLARPSARILGGLLFTCNGRGTRLFNAPNHDVDAIHRKLGPLPIAGFFAMGEMGPIGGANFIHGYTASLALFVAAD